MHMATKIRPRTLDEVHRLPDDGNKYELVRGELFVTPPPNDDHETVLARLSRIVDPYVEENGLGRRDQIQKKKLYLDVGIEEYWMVDPEQRCVTVVRPGHADLTVTDVVEWNPGGAERPLLVRLADLFG